MKRYARSQNKKKNATTPKHNASFQIKIGTNLDENVDSVKKMLDEPDDLIVRELSIGTDHQKAAIVYIKGMVDHKLVQDNILKTILEKEPEADIDLSDYFYQEIIAISDIKKVKTLDDVSLAILSGSTALYIDQTDTVLLMGTAGGEHRAIEEPQSERLIRGPRAGFIENIGTNVSLIRQDIKDPNLRFKTHEIGRRSKQKLVVSYIDGIVNPDLVQEINRRLQSIDTEYAVGSGEVEHWIQDSFLSPFPQLGDTERPDRAVDALLKGKVVILVDGTPFVLIAPMTLVETLHSLEDNSQRWIVGTSLRLLRFLSAFIAIFLPSVYIALISFHPEMLPAKLLFSIAASREGVPFPAFIEAMLMAITFEILHEAGVRLPKIIGATIGIVGGLVIGESAVSAGIVSPFLVIITALTAIASFATPQYSMAISFRLIRFTFMIAAATLGLYGIILVYIMINIHLVNLKSFGVPYSTPFGPLLLKDWKEMIIRAPIMMLTKRPSYLKTMDKTKRDPSNE
ncbi:spore germination protein [Aquibacillus koreensis]|uniref:Spore germination protein n=1 Tax=Aquibacillus koreensis TaxID=279446 RepID=A0A9X3WLG3_9BACI|nr:spore germination protein [Aquibacillus koreensis]MCT2536447.1 spore germination protein [Aquibacillus koreensis]MDC3419464.1 spore germination protein [Aquibacillus koreensis]